MPPIRYLLTNTTHEIPYFISFLAVPIILFPLASVEVERMLSRLKIVKKKLFTQMFQNFLNAVISIRQDCNSFDKITPNNSSQIDKCKTMYHLK